LNLKELEHSCGLAIENENINLKSIFNFNSIIDDYSIIENGKNLKLIIDEIHKKKKTPFI
jgi:hypothetical protein